ncbi:hypothetical protein [Mesorhizobium sp. IMUNJ 23232]|uniref:hypothetical protein n=1 Tax=Mesorhizobium sp. IMUNJ 23232 TaxID=3376064 RepID=UPI0037A16929
MLDVVVRMIRGDAQRAMDEALSALDHLSGTKTHLVMSGALDMSLGDRAAAYGKFLAAKKLPAPWFSALRGCETVRKWERRPPWLRPRSRPADWRSPITWVVPGKHSDLTVLCAANNRYFVHFAESFLLGLNDSTTPVHFHVVNWTEQCDAVLNRLNRRGGISVTHETYPHSGDKTYFATVRMLRAYDFLRTLGPLYISDIDNVFTRKPEDVRPMWGGADFAVKYTKWRGLLPWLSINAGYIYLNDTIRGLETALLMANYIDHLFKPNSQKSWYFDQLLLDEVAMHTGAKIKEITFANCPAISRQKEKPVATAKAVVVA